MVYDAYRPLRHWQFTNLDICSSQTHPDVRSKAHAEENNSDNSCAGFVACSDIGKSLKVAVEIRPSIWITFTRTPRGVCQDSRPWRWEETEEGSKDAHLLACTGRAIKRSGSPFETTHPAIVSSSALIDGSLC